MVQSSALIKTFGSQTSLLIEPGPRQEFATADCGPFVILNIEEINEMSDESIDSINGSNIGVTLSLTEKKSKTPRFRSTVYDEIESMGEYKK